MSSVNAGVNWRINSFDTMQKSLADGTGKGVVSY